MKKDSDDIKTNQRELTCKNCGSKLRFAPGLDSLKCPHCGTINEIRISDETIEEYDFVEFLKRGFDVAPRQEVTTVKCTSCGAETTFEPNIVSQSCPFCDSPLVISKGTTNEILQPKSLLPFKIDMKQSTETFQEWLSSLWFAPNDLKKYARQKGKFVGMYIPYWTYDSATITRYTGERGDNYVVTETYTNDQGEEEEREVVKIHWTFVSGRVDVDFDDVLVPASQSLPVNYVNALEPWDLPSLVPFDPSFLSGFKTESYQIDLKDGFEIAKQRMEPTIIEAINYDIGGDHQRIHTMETKYRDITFKHILLPLWISAYRYNEKVYRFLINARTGEVQGERPYSWIKITLFILMWIAIIVGVVFLVKKYKH